MDPTHPRDPEHSSSPEQPAAQADPGGGTLPPPEWVNHAGPASVASLALHRRVADPPVSRRRGPRAELAYLRGQLQARSEAGDAEGEREAAMDLARALAARGAELNTATRLARRALVLGDDSALREELSGWFAGLGELALAAAVLRPLGEQPAADRAAQMMTRVAVHLGRAGDAVGAAEALTQAVDTDRTDPVAPELLGAVGAWAPSAVPPDRACRGYLDGAERRDALGEGSAAFEDLLRAFEASAANTQAAERLAGSLVQRGRVGAAEEVLREHARALGARGHSVHLWRMADAAAAGDLPRAIDAALDATLDAEVDPHSACRALGLEAADSDTSIGFDELLERAGIYELLASRLEIAADDHPGAVRARCYVALGRLYDGPLGSSDRAVDCWVQALAADPSLAEPLARLRSHVASVRDQTPLIEAVLRVGTARPQEFDEERIQCLRALLELVEQRLADPALAVWGVEQLANVGADAGDLAGLEERVAEQLQKEEQTLQRLWVTLDTEVGSERLSGLKRIVALLRCRPDRIEEYVRLLDELVQLVPGERAWNDMLERALDRLGRVDRLEIVLSNAAERATSGAERERALLSLSSIARRRGDLETARRRLEPVLSDTGRHGLAWAMGLALAARSGNSARRARALLGLAARQAPPLRAVFASVAADLFLSTGDLQRAQHAAEQAQQADPSLARPVATLAQIAVRSERPELAAALERAMGVLVPRAEWCRALSRDYAEADEPALVLAWTQRWLALRPGHPRASEALLEQVTRHGDAARLADALGWLLSQPQPLTNLMEGLCSALRRLAELDPGRTGALARRALDVLGPRHDLLRETLFEVADLIAEPGLAITVTERWLAADGQGGQRAQMLLELARRRKSVNDADGSLRALVRALGEGADPSVVLEEVNLALRPRTSDGEVSILEARSETLSALSGADVQGAALAWREYGAALWDLASDSAGALRAWERAVVLDPERGIERYAQDLVSFAGHEAAVERLAEYAEHRQDAHDVARIFAAAAAAALAGELHDRALDLAIRAIEIDPTSADALAVAERATRTERIGDLERAYELIASAALGCYGERAAHYRAARQLEKRGALERAAAHAACAFEAVPAKGVTFVLLARLADRTGRHDVLVEALERVARRADTDAERADWLQTAASYTGTSDEGRRQRVEVLFRALAIRGDLATIAALAEAAAESAAISAEDRDILQIRLTRAARALFKQLGGPEGARVAIELARIALGVFGDTQIGGEAIQQALKCDGDVDEFERLADLLDRLLVNRELAAQLLSHAVDFTRQKWATLGRAALDYFVELARRLDDSRSRAVLLLHALRSDPDREGIVSRAAEAVRASGDDELMKNLMDAMPETRRAGALIGLADTSQSAGELAAAATALEQALAIDGLSATERTTIVGRLLDLYDGLGRAAPQRELLEAELDREELSDELRANYTRRLATSHAAAGEYQRAVGVLRVLSGNRPEDIELLGELMSLARHAGDATTCADALGQLVDLSSEADERRSWLRELAPLLDELGDPRALGRWTQLAAVDPQNDEALEALEREADRRGDYEEVVSLLRRRAEVATREEDSRPLRLRVAKVLEQRLGRHDEARVELERLLVERGDDPTVLCAAADLNQRLGDELRAAPLWLRASGVSRDRDEASSHARRACEAFLRGGDVTGARRVLDGTEPWTATDAAARLRVEVERRGEDPIALARALDELAEVAEEPPECRAAWLLEAARASEAAGDSEGAMRRAQKAAATTPSAAGPQLIARLLEYRCRGAGDAETAHATTRELRGIEGSLGPAQIELRAFLVAEALEVELGAEAALREIERAQQEVGDRPLVALGLAERLAQRGEVHRALDYFDVALAGDLRELRPRARVALGAARAAWAAGELDRSLEYLDSAKADAETRDAAIELKREIDASLQPAELRSRPPVAHEGGFEESGPLHPAVAEDVEVTQADAEQGAAAARAADGRAEQSAQAEQVSVETEREERGVAEPAPDEAATPMAAVEPLPFAWEPVAPEPEIDEGDRPSSLEEQPFPLTRVSLPPRVPAAAAEVRPRTPPPPPQRPRVPPAERPPSDAASGSTSAAPQSDERTFHSPSSRPAFTRPPAPAWPDEESSPTAARAVVNEESIPDSLDVPQAPRESDFPRRTVTEFPPMVPPPPRSPAEAQPALAPSPLSSDAKTKRGADAVLIAPIRDASIPPGGSVEIVSEQRLARELDEGRFDSGVQLVRRLAAEPDRVRERLAACRRLIELRPGEPMALDLLYEAAVADSNLAYAGALDHVRRAFIGEAWPAPALSMQEEQPDRVRLIVFGTPAVALEALEVVWEGASHVFKQDLSAYGVTGIERVPFAAPTPVARVYAAAARSLGIPAPLYQRRVPGEITIGLALLAQPSVIVTGEVKRTSPEFAYHLGVMLAAAMPGHALLCGSSERRATSVLRALAMAFGPPSATRSGLTSVANLAEVLWESLSARAQRHLKELCRQPEQLDYALAMGEVRRATRRAGLFVSGDLRVAAREVAAELEFPADRGLAAAAAACPEIADLVVLATSPEYAEARWQPRRPASRPPDGSWFA